MGRKRKGRASRKTKQSQKLEPDQLKYAPHTLVFHRGSTCVRLREIVNDIRQMMEPFTASRLKVRRKNVLKDFTTIAGIFHVTHLWMLSRSSTSMFLRIATLPSGPTLKFAINRYCLRRQVVATQRRHNTDQRLYATGPLLVMSGLDCTQRHMKLVSVMFQCSFPSLNVNTLKLNEVRRCLLLRYKEEFDSFEIRQYAIRVVPCGVNRSLKRLMVKGKIPDLSTCSDVSEVMYREIGSESEGEDTAEPVTLGQSMDSVLRTKGSKSSIRLTEIGPRLDLKLVCIEDGICDGNILYPEFKAKSPNKNQKRRAAIKAESKQMGDQIETPAADEPEGEDVHNSSDDEEYYKRMVGLIPDHDIDENMAERPV